MNKRWVCLALCLLLCLTACSRRPDPNAAAPFKTTFTSDNGKVHYDVSLEARLPKKSQPSYVAKPHELTADDVICVLSTVLQDPTTLEVSLEQAADCVLTVVTAYNGLSYAIRVEPDTSSEKGARLSVYLVGPDDPDEYGAFALKEQLCSVVKPSDATTASLSMRVQYWLDAFALGPWRVTGCEVVETASTTLDIAATCYEIHVTAALNFDSGPDALPGTLRSLDSYAISGMISQAEFVFAPTGDVLWLDLRSPVDVLSSKIPEKPNLGVSQLMELAGQYLMEKGITGTDEKPLTVQVTEFVYGLAQLTDGSNVYVPAVALRGTVSRSGQSDDSAQGSETELQDILVLNAQDGTVISGLAVQ